ncbi:death domain-containing protein CRADD [Cyclopterus lumpus]|uniref:CASP2 and RIPK1 domain containing adaptor with death domain n=1 Tax=Cyclopterus lumpus TaxID=8103 RepID=A0A8C3ABV3_CYCLU|nr:death domain-containing protein CRADD [Cyclopterus lumpus]XP_034382085.1 death domain-containing protein CRADD [Cyclopterus lumpus]
MDPVHRALLRTHRLYLSGQLLVTDTIVPFLYQEDILSDRHVEDIEAQTTSTLRCLRLLDLLPARGPRAFHCFLRSLEDFSWVRDKLLLELQTGPGPEASSADVQLPDSVLQKVPSDRFLSRLVSRLGSEWEAVLMDLGLSAEDWFRCSSDHRLSTHGAVLAGLVRWRQFGGKTATVQRLLRSLQDAGVHPSVLEDVLL